ncbi:multiple epidermal growth factor domains protein 11 [Elysia marginata]|uniref:Multiple epidermal growth factor domains protein 11 n=1 Tax=Elysia marginata TaxID=1093978 RepID=A0AAV4JQY8_9GAST|nr:multiple epidermal growth factor domains protein 11 [Elysia marginata]
MKQQPLLLIVTLLMPTFVAESSLKTYTEFFAEECFPSLPCTPDCSESAETGLQDLDLDVGVEQATCNQSLTSDTHCLCDTPTCYKLQELCLNTCEDTNTDRLKDCVSCLTTSGQTVKTLDDRPGNRTCTEQCKGMCLNPQCNATASEKCSTCAPGYKGKFCHEQCSPACSGECHAESGACLQCSAGSYGSECEFKCPENCLHGNCFRKNGSCQACAPGYTGHHCNKTCPHGLYGELCGLKCSTTCKGARCEHVHGQCAEGCIPGYFGAFCGKPCPDKMYGQDCLSHCPASCAEGKPCHHESGKCQAGCLSGFMGAYCNETCPENRYGANCFFNCSKSCFHRLCNAYSGTCLTCDESYYGSLCQYKIDLDEMKHGALDSEVPPMQAVLMIGGIAFLGVLMWIGVAYLLLQQRKRILKDAAKGIDPRYSQWGMFPNMRSFRRAVRLYDQKWANQGGGDTETSDESESSEDENTNIENENKRKRMLDKARKKLWSWTNFKGEKLKPPNEVDLERVSKWLARHHGIQHPTKSESSRVALVDKIQSKNETTESSSISEDLKSDLEGDTKCTTQDTFAAGQNPETNETIGAGVSTEINTSQDQQENTITHTSTTRPASEGQTSVVRVVSSCERVCVGNVPIRADTIYLSPEPQPGGPKTMAGIKYLKETTRVKWMSNEAYGPRKDNRLGSTSSKEPISSTATSTSSSKPESTSSTSSSASSDSSTVTNTNTSWRTRDDSDSSTSDDTSDSSSSEEESDTSEGTSQSTKVTTRKDLSGMEEFSFPFKNRLTFAAVSDKKTGEDEDTTVEEEPEAPTFFQRLAGIFKRKPKNPEQNEPSPGLAVTGLSNSGAGGLPRPFSNKFLINRLETWNRNKGLEVRMNDGVMEVASSKNQRKIQGKAKELAGQSASIRSKRCEDSSYESTDLSDKTHHKTYSTSKRSNTTSGEDMTDVPSTMVTESVKML